MKYVDEYRDGARARRIAQGIAERANPDRRYAFMEFCGGHTHSICRYGLEDLLPSNVELIHGPGCPVCVLPIGRLDQAIALARRPEIVLCTYGDMVRVPASDRSSLLKAKAEGADIRMVYGAAEALEIARANPAREIVFFAIGFETTTPPTAVAILAAAREGLANFSVFANHVMTAPALAALLGADPTVGVRIDGFVAPGHVSTIAGTAIYRPFAERYRKPFVVSGFEPLDILLSVSMLIDQIEDGRCEVENEYARAARADGNPKARGLIDAVFEVRESFEWRGLGALPDSALKIRDAYAAFDAERRWPVAYRSVPDHPACACPEILRGQKKPTDCRIFGTACTPDHPVGSCMVSPEGGCAAYYQFGRRKRLAEVA